MFTIKIARKVLAQHEANGRNLLTASIQGLLHIRKHGDWTGLAYLAAHAPRHDADQIKSLIRESGGQFRLDKKSKVGGKIVGLSRGFESDFLETLFAQFTNPHPDGFIARCNLHHPELIKAINAAKAVRLDAERNAAKFEVAERIAKQPAPVLDQEPQERKHNPAKPIKKQPAKAVQEETDPKAGGNVAAIVEAFTALFVAESPEWRAAIIASLELAAEAADAKAKAA